MIFYLALISLFLTKKFICFIIKVWNIFTKFFNHLIFSTLCVQWPYTPNYKTSLKYVHIFNFSLDRGY